MRKTQEENTRQILARALDMCKELQVDATAAIVEGDAKEAICQAVERMQAGLLVLGSRGLGKIKRYPRTPSARCKIQILRGSWLFVTAIAGRSWAA